MRRTLFFGYMALTIAQITISANVVVSKLLLHSISMFMLLACRFGLSTLFLGVILKLTQTPIKDAAHPNGKLTLTDWLLASLQGLFAAFLFNVFFVWGLQLTTATAAGIVGSTLPVIIALSAVWILKEKLTWSKVGALILAMLGILVINLDHFEEGGSISHHYFGDFLIFLAMIPEAWYSIISRKLAGRITPLGGAFIANAVGFFTLLPLALLTGSFDFNLVGASEFGLLLMAAGSSLLFFWAWAWGLSFIPASTAALFGGVMPIATTFFAVSLLKESLHWYDLLGMLMVIFSILIGAGITPFFRRSIRV